MDCIVYEIPMVYTKSKGIDEAFILVVALGYVDYRSNDNIVRVYKHTWIGWLCVFEDGTIFAHYEVLNVSVTWMVTWCHGGKSGFLFQLSFFSANRCLMSFDALYL